MVADIEEIDRMIGQFLRYVRSGYREPAAQALRPFHRLRDQPGEGHTGLGLAMVGRPRSAPFG
jgi:hypothetical protein